MAFVGALAVQSKFKFYYCIAECVASLISNFNVMKGTDVGWSVGSNNGWILYPIKPVLYKGPQRGNAKTRLRHLALN